MTSAPESEIPASEDRFTRPIAAMLSYSVAAMIVGQSCLFTVLPPIGRQIGLAEYQIGLVMSVHGLFMLFTGPVAGTLSEIWGRRRILVGGSALYAGSIMLFGFIIDAASRGLLAVSTVLVLLVSSRAVFAIGAGAVTPGAMALAADLSSRDRRLHAMSLISTAISVGAILGPSSAAFFTGLGPAVAFYVIAGFAMAGAIAARFVLPEPPRHVRTPGRLGLTGLWGRPMMMAASSALYLLGCYGIYAVLGFHFQDRFVLNTTDAAQMFGLALMASAATNVLTQTFVIRPLKAGVTTMMFIGVPVTIAGFLLMGFGTLVPVVFAGMLICAAGQGFANAALATGLSLSVGASGQGRVAGLSTSAQAIAFLIGPSGGAMLYQSGFHLPFEVGSAICAAALVLYFTTARAKTASIDQ